MMHNMPPKRMKLTPHRAKANIPTSSLVFSFQAEDGIRDLTVTGVQTCALPIYPQGYVRGDRLPGAGDADRAGARGLFAGARGSAAARDGKEESRSDGPGAWRFCAGMRSGERRVGREGRSRWLPYH